MSALLACLPLAGCVASDDEIEIVAQADGPPQSYVWTNFRLTSTQTLLTASFVACDGAPSERCGAKAVARFKSTPELDAMVAPMIRDRGESFLSVLSYMLECDDRDGVFVWGLSNPSLILAELDEHGNVRWADGAEDYDREPQRQGLPGADGLFVGDEQFGKGPLRCELRIGVRGDDLAHTPGFDHLDVGFVGVSTRYPSQ